MATPEDRRPNRSGNSRSRNGLILVVGVAIVIVLGILSFLWADSQPAVPVDPPPDTTENAADAPMETEPPEPESDALQENPR